MTQSSVYLFLAPFALLMVAVSFVFSLVNKRQLESLLHLPFMGTIAFVIIFTVFELHATSKAELLLASHLAYTFLTFVPLCWLLACAGYASTIGSLSRPVSLTILLVVPVTTSFLAWTNDRFHLLWISNDIVQHGDFLINRVTRYGPWFWVHITYAYALYFAGTALVLRDYFRQRGSQRPISILGVIASSVPLAFNLLYIFRLIPGIHRDYSTLVFAPTSFIFIVWKTRKALMASNARDTRDHPFKGQSVMPAGDPMSKRELAVYDLLLEGLSNKEIAAKLCISENTAKTHTRHIYRKLGISNRHELRDSGSHLRN